MTSHRQTYTNDFPRNGFFIFFRSASRHNTTGISIQTLLGIFAVCAVSTQRPRPVEVYRMVSFNLKVLAKFGLCSNCSQRLNGCSLVRARKIFADCLSNARARKNKQSARRCLAKTILYPSVALLNWPRYSHFIVYSLQFTPESYE